MVIPASSSRPVWAPILLYHRVVPVLPEHDPFGNCVTTATFESHLRWLAHRGYRSLSLADLETRFGPNAARAPLPPRRAIAITFDDGYHDNYLHAWPLLKQYGFSATIFLVSDAIGGDNGFDAAYHRRGPASMLSAGQIEEMHRHGGIGFGSHSCSHPDSLVPLSQPCLEDELLRSRITIEQIIQAPVAHFAYPHSQRDDRVEAAVRRAGYRLACAGVGTRFSPLCLHRIEARSRQGVLLEAHLKERWGKWLVRRPAQGTG